MNKHFIKHKLIPIIYDITNMSLIDYNITDENFNFKLLLTRYKKEKQEIQLPNFIIVNKIKQLQTDNYHLYCQISQCDISFIKKIYEKGKESQIKNF